MSSFHLIIDRVIMINIKEEAMITRFHGIDKHKKYSTISVLNRKGEYGE